MAVSSTHLSCACWQWRRDDDGFSPYPPEVSREIEQAYVSGKLTVSLPNHTVDIVNRVQRNKSSGYERIVMRVPLQLPIGQSTTAYWTWAEHYNHFIPYDVQASIVIEEHYQRKCATVDLSRTSVAIPYTINFTKMEQKRHNYKTVRKIQRCPLPTGTTIQSLLAIPGVASPTPASYVSSYPAVSAPFATSTSTSGGVLKSGTTIPTHPYPAPSTTPSLANGLTSFLSSGVSMVSGYLGLSNSTVSTTASTSGSTASTHLTPANSVTMPPTSFASPRTPYTSTAMSTVTAYPSSGVPHPTTGHTLSSSVDVSSKVKPHYFSTPSDVLQANSLTGYTKSSSKTTSSTVPVSKSGGGPVLEAGANATRSPRATRSVKTAKPVAKPRKKNSKKTSGGGVGVASKGGRVSAKVRGLDEQFSGYVRMVEWVKSDQDGPCPICMNQLTEEAGFDDDEQLPPTSIPKLDVCKLRGCRHMLHRPCLLMYIKSTGTQSGFQCPNCKKSYGVKTGDMPTGTMTVTTRGSSLPGHEGYSTIVIAYNFRAGVHNGRRYRVNGFPRTCYLPDSPKGQKVLRLLRTAWDRKLTFTIGTSVTTGASDTVVWNEIHHKTEINNHSGHGYPDPNYLDNVLRELAAQGVEEGGGGGVEECESEDEAFVISSDDDSNP